MSVMTRREYIEAVWSIRPLKWLRFDREHARLWVTLLGVFGGIGLTLLAGWLVLMHVEVHVLYDVESYNRGVTRDRLVLGWMGVVLAAALTAGALWWRAKALRYGEQLGVEPPHWRAQMWVLLALAAAVLLACLLISYTCFTYLPADGPAGRHVR